jgi:anti-anti-sigma factor
VSHGASDLQGGRTECGSLPAEKKEKQEENRMEIRKTQEGSTLTIALVGRLDTTTAPRLEAELKTGIGGVMELIFDFAELEYISSAGLRVILSAQKVMNRQGSMVIRNVNENVMEVFEVTGFVDILTIE